MCCKMLVLQATTLSTGVLPTSVLSLLLMSRRTYGVCSPLVLEAGVDDVILLRDGQCYDTNSPLGAPAGSDYGVSSRCFVHTPPKGQGGAAPVCLPAKCTATGGGVVLSMGGIDVPCTPGQDVPTPGGGEVAQAEVAPVLTFETNTAAGVSASVRMCINAPRPCPHNAGTVKCPTGDGPCPYLGCPNDCNAHGVCVNSVCQCYLGFTGDTCQSWVAPIAVSSQAVSQAPLSSPTVTSAPVTAPEAPSGDVHHNRSPHTPFLSIPVFFGTFFASAAGVLGLALAGWGLWKVTLSKVVCYTTCALCHHLQHCLINRSFCVCRLAGCCGSQGVSRQGHDNRHGRTCPGGTKCSTPPHTRTQLGLRPALAAVGARCDARCCS